MFFRLEGMRACDIDGAEFVTTDLLKGLKPVGPNVSEETMIQSVATALHVSGSPVTGQNREKPLLEKDPGAYINPKQPLVQAVSVSEEDIKRQEEKVIEARRKLQDALKV